VSWVLCTVAQVPVRMGVTYFQVMLTHQH